MFCCIYITTDAAQKFALKSQTDQGNKVADFFVHTLKRVQEFHIISELRDKKRVAALSTENGILSIMEDGKKTVCNGVLRTPLRELPAIARHR